MADRSQSEPALVQFSERLTNSAAFGALFREGMDLVEETAAYLDGDGRTDAKALERSVSLTYATESMRLTTRLMQLASWLLLHRAVKEGEMTLAQANKEKKKVRLVSGEPIDTKMLASRPDRLQDLIERSRDQAVLADSNAPHKRVATVGSRRPAAAELAIIPRTTTNLRTYDGRRGGQALEPAFCCAVPAHYAR